MRRAGEGEERKMGEGRKWRDGWVRGRIQWREDQGEEGREKRVKNMEEPNRCREEEGSEEENDGGTMKMS